MEPRPRTDELRFIRILAVIDHEREIEGAVGHVTRYVLTIASGRHLLEPEHIFVEACRRFQILDFDCEMDDTGSFGLPGFFVPAGCLRLL
jgi:hypothetical protein